MAVLSDGENYISARLTAACRSLCMTEFDTDILDARGAIVLLRKWERIASPSFSEFLLVVDELTHMVGVARRSICVCVCACLT